MAKLSHAHMAQAAKQLPILTVPCCAGEGPFGTAA